MSLVRRASAAVSGLFLLQLTLLGSGTLCAMHRGVDGPAGSHVMQSTQSMQAMHDMDGTGDDASSHSSVIAVRASASEAPMRSGDCDGAGPHESCSLPFSAGQCAAMTACDVTVGPPSGLAMTSLVRVIGVASAAPAALHSGPTFAPELPPPRA